MGGIICVALTGFLGSPGNVEGRNEVGFKKGMCIAHQNLLFPSSNDFFFFLDNYFRLLPTSIKGLR